MWMGFGLMSRLFPIIFFGMFIFVIVTIISTASKDAAQRRRNNASPVLTVEAIVVTKRQDVSHRSNVNQDGMHHSSSYTSYYVTFEVESGDRMEFEVGGPEYGMLVEGDCGKLTFQGTRYLGFVRQ